MYTMQYTLHKPKYTHRAHFPAQKYAVISLPVKIMCMM